MGSVTRNSLIFISGLCNLLSYVKIFEIFLQCANIFGGILAVRKYLVLDILVTSQTLEFESEAVPFGNLVSHLN